MKQLMKNLMELQTQESGPGESRASKARVAQLRAQIPAQVLVHYDRMMARGKKGVATIHNQNCTGCHIRVPLATIMNLKHAEDIQLCGNCGRYLYLPEEEATPPVPAPVKKTAARKPRRAA